MTNGDKRTDTDPNSSVAIDVSDTQVRSSLNSLKKTNLSPTVDPNVEEKEALSKADFDQLISEMNEELDVCDKPIEKLRNLDLIVFDNSIR